MELSCQSRAEPLSLRPDIHLEEGVTISARLQSQATKISLQVLGILVGGSQDMRSQLSLEEEVD